VTDSFCILCVCDKKWLCYFLSHTKSGSATFCHIHKEYKKNQSLFVTYMENTKRIRHIHKEYLEKVSISDIMSNFINLNNTRQVLFGCNNGITSHILPV